MPPKSDKIWADALSRAVRRESKGKGSPQWLDVIADRVVVEASDGNPAAFKELGDRLDGKPLAQKDHVSSDGSMTPITKIQHEVIPVPKRNDD